MSKYEELEQRISKVTGWDKGADDIISELRVYKDSSLVSTHLCIDLSDTKNGIGYMKVVTSEKEVLYSRIYCSQREKLKVFKDILLWLLERSKIKKDEKYRKIVEIEKQVEELQEKLREIKEEE